MSTITAVIYCRISQDREGKGEGVARQESDCRALAERLGWEVSHVYIDNDISASTKSNKPRPEYERMLAAAEAGTVRRIIAYSNSRLTRRPRELEGLVELHNRTGIEIRTVVSGEYDLSTADGRLHARLLGSIDAAESERTAERLIAAKAQQAAQGRYRGGARQFGRIVPGMGIHDAEAAELRDAAGRVLAGESLSSIKRDWDSRGIRTARGGTWTVTAIRKVLARPSNAALVCNGQFGEKDFRIVGPAAWPAIWPRETMERLHALFSDPKRRTSTSYERVHFLAHLAVCGAVVDGGECGAKLTVIPTSPSRGKPRGRIYRCPRHTAVYKEALESYVEEVVIARMTADDAAEAFRPAAPDLEPVREELDRLTRRKAEAARMFATGVIDSDDLSQIMAELGPKIAKLERDLALADQASPLRELAGPRAAEVWGGWNANQKHAAVDALMKVTVLPVGRGSRAAIEDRVRIEWKGRAAEHAAPQ
ncbi:hypothetical protein AXK57_21700 [Tsukamurella pulmonis]|uniref:recombinase family protein n=1 Tax=Tsukamurella pulmonis TaxID=47312 RepID=UPI00079776A2|nr:recombinase family protein [Tsukamurella pulmonis]KXP11649.1 hypothetical protein AXK57_21700 [Tsukamurella pulmonis]